ncbi:MAG: NAD(P)-dependent dehydrogenase (short-subunit alcohol dehydrogenase family) [Myxococcota bacterium]|jgi:NAD(P)-dependent dehydrogenase (short-subunit alcohol dehydrogenase family)
MTNNASKTALVTGSNSGLGFEAAARFAELGYRRVILATRTLAKAEAARKQLVDRTGKDPFEALVVDVSNNATVKAAVETLAKRGGLIDAVLLNAGLMAGSEIGRNDDGVELTVAASVIGHHVLTMGLLEEGLLNDDARIVLAGSEAARGDVPMMGLTDVATFAQEHTAGDRSQAIEAIARAEAPYGYKNMAHYAMAKLILAWWVAALSRRLPSGVSVYAVSPGSAPATSGARHQPWLMRVFGAWLMGSWFGQAVGMGAPVSKAAERYIDAFAYSADKSGYFFASAPGKMVGDVVRQVQPHVLDEANQEAAWSAVVHLSGTDIPRGSMAVGA